MRLTEEELQAIRERAEKATPGPWDWCALYIDDLWTYEDAKFLTHARTDVLCLLEEVKALKAENKLLKDALIKLMADFEARIDGGFRKDHDAIAEAELLIAKAELQGRRLDKLCEKTDPIEYKISLWRRDGEYENMTWHQYSDDKEQAERLWNFAVVEVLNGKEDLAELHECERIRYFKKEVK